MCVSLGYDRRYVSVPKSGIQVVTPDGWWHALTIELLWFKRRLMVASVCSRRPFRRYRVRSQLGARKHFLRIWAWQKFHVVITIRKLLQKRLVHSYWIKLSGVSKIFWPNSQNKISKGRLVSETVDLVSVVYVMNVFEMKREKDSWENQLSILKKYFRDLTVITHRYPSPVLAVAELTLN